MSMIKVYKYFIHFVFLNKIEVLIAITCKSRDQNITGV